IQTFTAGDFCILPPSARHLQSACDKCDTIKILVRLSAFTEVCAGLLKGQDLLSRFLLSSIYNENSGQCLLFRTGQDEAVREHIFDMFGEMLSPNPYTDRILTGMLMVLLLRLSKSCPAVTQAVPLGNSDHEILLYIQEHYSTITLEQLAAHLHYTVPYCSRYIKKLFGCTFSQLLKQIRFRKADLLLKNSTLTINQISKMIGYENPENFMRAFKKRHQMTPSQYRNLYAEKKE
ncbi:MAG: AraC family transcriptional regulator, partial [Lachnospiraceae bacterium]|nr:AraC family transcriptional regulator [Lachnospiraceae bacterium]